MEHANGKQRKNFLRASIETKVLPFATVVFHLPLFISLISVMMWGFFIVFNSAYQVKPVEGGFFMSNKFGGKSNKADARDLLITAATGGTPKSQPGCERIAGGVAGVTVP